MGERLRYIKHLVSSCRVVYAHKNVYPVIMMAVADQYVRDIGSR
jgi:hypothetical protein